MYALKCFAGEPHECKNCAYRHERWETCTGIGEVCKDAVHLIRIQEPVPVKRVPFSDDGIDYIYRCGVCNSHFFFKGQKFCQTCGQEAKWG